MVTITHSRPSDAVAARLIEAKQAEMAGLHRQ
jgi:hypothetical protein